MVYALPRLSAVPDTFDPSAWQITECGTVDFPDGLLAGDSFLWSMEFQEHVKHLVASRFKDDPLRQELLYGLELPGRYGYNMQPYALVKLDNNGTCYKIRAMHDWFDGDDLSR